MNIPTQFYEQDFLDFEKYLQLTQVHKIASDNPHANSEFCLQQFAMYEKFRKAEEVKYRRRMFRASAKCKGNAKISEMKNSASEGGKVIVGKKDKVCMESAAGSQSMVVTILLLQFMF